MAPEDRSQQAKTFAGDVGVGIVDHKAVALGAPGLLVAVAGVVVAVVSSGGWQLVGIAMVVLGLAAVAVVVAGRVLAARGIRQRPAPLTRCVLAPAASPQP
jgi:hypothetical protein